MLIGLAAAARLAWLSILPRGAMSLDLLAWKAVAIALIQGRNPYQATHWLNHPPFWMEILSILGRLSATKGTDFVLSVRLVLIAGDLLLLAATYQLLRTLQPAARHGRLLVIGYCLNPLLILLTVQHANFDALAMTWVILFLYFLIRFRRSSDLVDWLWAAVCLGIAVYVKQFPLVLWPLLVPGARQLDWRSRFAGAMLVIAPAALSLMPLYVLAPDSIVQNVLEYRSLGNTFGLVGLITLAGYHTFLPLYSEMFVVAILLGTIVVAIGLWRQNWRFDNDPVLFSAMLLLALFAVGPGYGSQYWFWIVPLILVCYPNFGVGFQRVIWICMTIVVATNLFEYAVELDLGRFLFNFFPTRTMQALGDYFPYPSEHLILLRMPMSFATFLLLSSGVLTLMRRYRQPSAGKPTTS